MRSEHFSRVKYELDRLKANGTTETFRTIAMDTIPAEIKRTWMRNSQFRLLGDAIVSLTLRGLWSSVEILLSV